MNKRETERVQVALRCHVVVAGVSLGWMWTENMSRHGILLRWREDVALPPLGELITIEIELPPHRNFPPKCMHCQATVVRVRTLKPSVAMVGLNVNVMNFREFRSDLSKLALLPVQEWAV